MSAQQTFTIEADVSQLIADFEWLRDQLFERFPQGVSDRIGNLEGFLARVRDEVVQLEDSSACDTDRFVIRFGLRGRTELLATAVAALDGDISQVNRLHGVLQ